MRSKMTVMDLFDMIGGKFVYVTTFRFPPDAPQLKSLSCLIAFLVAEIDLNIEQTFSLAYLDGDYELQTIKSDEEYEKIMDLATAFDEPVQLVFIGMSVSDQFKNRKGGIPVEEKLMTNLETFIRSNHMFEEGPMFQSSVYADKIAIFPEKKLFDLSGTHSTEKCAAMQLQPDVEFFTTESIQNIQRMMAEVPYEEYVAVPVEEPAQPTKRLVDISAELYVDELDVLTRETSEIDLQVKADTLAFEKLIKSDGGQSASVFDIDRANRAPSQNKVRQAESQNTMSSDLKKYRHAKTVRNSLKMTEKTLLWRINYLMNMQDNLNSKVKEGENEMELVEHYCQKLSDYERTMESGGDTDVLADIKEKDNDELPAQRSRTRGRGRGSHRKSRKGKK